MASLIYNGTEIKWFEKHKIVHRFAATSGMKTYQKPKNQCDKDLGPVPEGTYVLRLQYNKKHIAVVADPKTCKLQAASGIQMIPDGDIAKGTSHCTQYWNNWGSNRVRIDAYDKKAKKACLGKRNGFYIHDSTKGFSHGCIEVNHKFFTKLYDLVNSDPKHRLMLLNVDYSGTITTLGKTSS